MEPDADEPTLEQPPASAELGAGGADEPVTEEPVEERSGAEGDRDECVAAPRRQRDRATRKSASAPPEPPAERSATRSRGARAYRWGAALAGVLVLVVWHLYVAHGIARGYGDSPNDSGLAESGDTDDTVTTSTGAVPGPKVSVNPWLNIVTVAVEDDARGASGNAFAALGAALGGAVLQSMGPDVMERQLALRSRRYLDVYAWLLPYRVEVVSVPPDPAKIERMRQLRADLERDRERRKAEAERARTQPQRDYIRSHLVLENPHVSAGETTLGRKGSFIVATILNTGDRVLDRVTVRVYYLDDTGRRIGEKEYSPVFVGATDRTPLRPGYRKDFGYLLDEDAPSGWSQRIEAEIVAVEFAAQ